MALKVLMLRKKLSQKQAELEQLRKAAEEFETREAELTQAIDEAETEEAQAVVDEAIEEFNSERTAHMEKIADLEKEISELENDLAAEEREQATEPVKAEEPEKREVKKEMNTAEKRNRFGLNEEIMTRAGVPEFMEQVRTCMKEKRALTNVGVLIPEVFLGLLRENVENYSKLYRHVNARRLSGTGRLAVMGTIPEAIWVECCGKLNELDLAFSEVEVDCFKVAGYFAVCNATLEDSDIDLASELLTALSQAIGLALDKAILYGTGVKMPQGVVTAIGASETLAASNMFQHDDTVQDAALFKQLILDSGAAKGKYARGEKVWCMNETTYTALIANAMTVDAGGAIVTGVNGRMPVIGGIIEVLNFIPDGVIIGGYFDLYLLAERAAVQISQSEHVKFLDDETVFKGTARYDGKPVIPDAFIVIGINNADPSEAPDFPQDTANSAGDNEGN